ncbi:MAG: hypothetical protein LBV16_06480 [Elusimicrobiota bacterium]|jgi:predicted transcriptional regulator of viral defense system|nr:hypothetical protein [Elusimicrobiota bacterium]
MNTFYALNADETKVIAWLSYDKRQIITYDEFDRYLPQNYKYKNKFISRLIRKKILNPIKRGVYNFVPMGSLATGITVGTNLLPKIYYPNMEYYIGYFNMFNFYGLTEQMPQTTFVINNLKSGEKVIDNFMFKFIKVKDEYIYGIVEQKYMNDIIKVSDKERTMIDFVNRWNYQEAKKKLSAIIKENKCDVNKFIDYAVRYPTIKTRKLVGIILDEADISEKLSNPLLNSIQNSALISTSSYSREGKINKKWGVILNA